MSTLQISLAVAGGVVLAAVVAHGAWSSRKNSPRLPDPQAPAPDSLQPPLPVTDADRLEPTLDGLPGGPADAQRPAGLDPLIDVLAPLALDAPVSGDAVIAAMPGSRRVGSKPFAVEGRREGEQVFEAPVSGARYTALQAGVQLANRMGALNNIEFSEFVMKTQSLADALGASPDFPDMLEQVARARELDAFASSHDAQLSFTVRASSAAWSPGYVHQHAARLGFVPGSLPGRLVLPASQPGVPAVLVLNFDPQAAMAEDPEQTALREVLLTLDVAHVQRAEQPYVRLRQCAAALAAAMDGVVTDDHAQVLRTEAMDAVGADLEHLYDALQARGLAAGSLLARRLFS